MRYTTQKKNDYILIHNPDGTIDHGMQAHYACEECHKLFNMNKQEKSAEKLAITEPEHRFYDENSDGKCDDCEKILEKLAQEQEKAEQSMENGGGNDESAGVPWWIVLLLALLATAGGVVGALLLVKNKKADPENKVDEKKENAE